MDLDIVEWLRAEAELVALPRLKEAADEIERLRADVKSYAGEIANQQDENDRLRVEIDRIEEKPQCD